MTSTGYRFALLAILAISPLVLRASPPVKATNAPAPQEVKSTFVMPNSPKDGCDPFYPKATSLYQTATVAPVKPVSRGIDLLKYTGNFGTSMGSINDQNLAVGETQDIKTSAGLVSVRLLQINPDGSLIIEANGERRELKPAGEGQSHP